MVGSTSLTPTKLTKEEEASAGSEDMEVRREDQEKINKFSSLHQKETNLEEELRAKIVSAVPLCWCIDDTFPSLSTIGPGQDRGSDHIFHCIADEDLICLSRSWE